ncbi:unnamed protein product [Musa acuminata var. zebrina]
MPQKPQWHAQKKVNLHETSRETMPDSSCFGEVAKGRSAEADSRRKQKSTELNEVVSNGEELNETTSCEEELTLSLLRFLVQTLTSMLQNISFMAMSDHHVFVLSSAC